MIYFALFCLDASSFSFYLPFNKPLTLLSVKKNDEDFQLGGKGYGVEFCLLWNAIRISMSITENETD